MGRGERALGGANLRLGGFDVGAAVEGLMDGVVEGERGRGGEGDLVGEVVGVVGGKAGDARERDLLLGQLCLQRDDALLLGELLYLAAIHVNLGRDADSTLLLRLLE